MECVRRNNPGLVSPYFFPLTLHPGRQIPTPPQTAMLSLPSYLGGETPRKEAARGNPATRRLGDQGTFQSSSSPEGPPSFLCPRLALAVGGPAWIWRLWSHPQGTRHSRSKGGSLAATSSPAPSAPGQPSLGTQARSGCRDVTPAQVTEA